MNQLQVQKQNQAPVQAADKEQRLEALDYAKFLFNAGMAPECFKTPEALAVTMLRGAELGFTYSDSVTSLYVVKNAVASYAKTVVYMFEKHGGLVELLEWDADHAKIRLTQRGRAPLVVAWTLAECKQAGWNTEPVRDDKGKPTGQMKEKYTWSHMPRVMVLKRTLKLGIEAYSPASQFARTFDPDVVSDVEEDTESDGDEVDAEVNEIVTDVKRTQELAPVEAEVKPEPPAQVKPHWSTDTQVRKIFWQWCTLQGLNTAEVHSIAGIAHLAEYAGTEKQLCDLILAHVASVTAKPTETLL